MLPENILQCNAPFQNVGNVTYYVTPGYMMLNILGVKFHNEKVVPSFALN